MTGPHSHALGRIGSRIGLALVISHACPAATESTGDRMLAEYFRAEVAQIHAANFAAIKTLDDWTRERGRAREQFREMLGLSPAPAKTDLQAVVTGRVELDDIVVEKLHFQSLPGLYVTADLYLPRKREGKVPAILYVCGHSNVKEGGVSYGAKVHYQHHGAWFAQHGYVCLVIDTIQLGELEGIHHGTYRYGMWWWNARGYTPAGVETWNAIRALDYLETRPEVDATRLGMTGRSGGGAYTWFTAALDERVKVAAPVSGMTDLKNYVLDGCVAGHCDCMFLVNTYRWDLSKVAALLAPRPLLLSNCDAERIFPLDGVLRVRDDVATIYRLYGKAADFGLVITPGDHKDGQELQVPVLRWFDRYLKGANPLVADAATARFTAQQLKVFAALPADERTTKIHETFVPQAAPAVPAGAAEWERLRAGWMQALREKSFAGWPATPEPLRPTRVTERTEGAVHVTVWEFTSQSAMRLPLVVYARDGASKAQRIVLRVVDESAWREPAIDPATRAEIERGHTALVFFPPRGIGPSAWSGDVKAQIQIRRRFMLLGQTLDGMRVWDTCRAIEALRQPEIFGAWPVQLVGTRFQAVNALYASLFASGVASLEMIAPPASHRTGPDYLSVLRYLDVPQAVAMAAERLPVRIASGRASDWAWAGDTARRLGWPADRLRW